MQEYHMVRHKISTCYGSLSTHITHVSGLQMVKLQSYGAKLLSYVLDPSSSSCFKREHLKIVLQ